MNGTRALGSPGVLRRFSVFNLFDQIFVGTGETVMLLGQALANARASLRSPGNVIAQMAEMGYRSLPLAAFVGFFAGMVIALQIALVNRDSYHLYIGWFVGVAMINEFGPIFTAIILTGRVGAAMTAQIATMRVSEEIDALRSMAISPVRYLATPRILAAMLMTPILSIFCVVVGVLGGELIATGFLRTPEGVFWCNLYDHVGLADLGRCIVKAWVFGTVIATVGCHAGLTAEGGAEGVGRATTRSVVISLTLILILDYFVTRFTGFATL